MAIGSDPTLRRRPYLTLDEEGVRARAAPCFGGRRAEHIDSIRLLPGGACNTNYGFRVGSEEFVLRIYGRGDAEAGGRERFVTGLVKDRVPVPEVLHVGDGFAVVRFLSGAPLGGTPTEGQATAAATALASIASIALPRAGELLGDGTVRPWDFGAVGGFVESRLESPRLRAALGDAVDGVRRLLEREAATFAEMDQECRLVHGDFNPGNVLMTGGRVSGVLDWEFSHSGTPMMDIGNLLRHLGPTYESAVATGLKAGGMVLHPDWRRRASLVDLSSHLEFLASPDDLPEAFRRRCVERVMALLD